VTLIFRMGQGACGTLFCLECQPIPHLWKAATNRHADDQWCKTTNLQSSIDAHFAMRVSTICYHLIWPTMSLIMIWLPSSAKNISVQAEWLRQSECALSEPSETPRWRITPRLVSIPRVALHIALRSPFHCFFSLCWSPILNKHSGVVANSDHTSEWVDWVHVWIAIAMGDAPKISPRIPSTLSSRSIGRWEDMILPGREDPRNCADPQNLGQSEWDQKLGKIECEFSLYDKRRWKWDDVYLLRGLPNIYSPSLCPPLLPLYLWICTWRLRSSELRDALGGCDRASLEMHLEAMLVRTWRP